MQQEPAGLLDNSIQRRTLLKMGAALGGVVALSGARGARLTEKAHAETAPVEGKWIPADCWVDCGSKGFNKVYVVDGKPVAHGTDQSGEDTIGCPRLKACAKGHAQRQHIFGADRLKYPMKRKHWEPGGGDKSLRGRDEWIRISWDEALDIVSSEIKRISEKYGNEAILVPGYVASLFGHWDIGRMLALYGGYMENWGSCSSGAWGSVSPYVGLPEDYNDRLDLYNADTIVLWGSNTAWGRAGLPTHYYTEMKKQGVKFIVVDVFRHPTAQVLADEWIPCRPGTDQALIIGLAHALLEMDDPDTNPLIDWDFLNRCTVGFDEDHMPDGADPKDNFKDYVLGTYDDIPKTPEWASEICGVPASRIRSFAKELGMQNNVCICMSPAPARTTTGTLLPQSIMTLGAMTGHIGKSGNMTGSDTGHSWLVGGPPIIIAGNLMGDPSWTTPGGKPWISNPIGGESISPRTGTPNGMYERPKDPYTRINVNELWTSILEGKYTAGENDIRECKTQMIYHTHSNLLNQAPGTMLAIEAHRQVEFVVTQNIVMSTTAQYSDVVLPVTSQWERYGNISQGYREQIVWYSQITEPLFEAQDDIWIAVELGKRLGLDPEEIDPFSLKQEVFNQAAGAIFVEEDGKTQSPLLTITQEDIDEFGVEGEPQQGHIPIKQLQENGIYKVERTPDDNYGHIVLKDFRDDPEANPLTTRSGKLQIHCQELVDEVKACGWQEIPPIPKYSPGIEGYEETFSDWDNKVKGEFPLQFVSVQVLRHAHSTFGNVPSLQEAFDLPVYMNPLDAAERGIESGDQVLVTSKWGKVLRPASVTDIVMPGVTILGEGAWVDIDEETGIDIGGNANSLCGPNIVGFGHQSWSSCIVQVEKWQGKEMLPDHQRPQNVPLKEV